MRLTMAEVGRWYEARQGRSLRQPRRPGTYPTLPAAPAFPRSLGGQLGGQKAISP